MVAIVLQPFHVKLNFIGTWTDERAVAEAAKWRRFDDGFSHRHRRRHREMTVDHANWKLTV